MVCDHHKGKRTQYAILIQMKDKNYTLNEIINVYEAIIHKYLPKIA